MTAILTATQENEGVGTVSQVKIRQKNRTRKALNIAVEGLFNGYRHCYEPVGRGFESPAACQNSEVDICLLRYFYMLRRVREPSVYRGPRKAFGFVGKGETYGVFVTNWLDNLFEYGICLDAVPLQRATINVYNLYFLFVKIYNTISLEIWLLTTI